MQNLLLCNQMGKGNTCVYFWVENLFELKIRYLIAEKTNIIWYNVCKHTCACRSDTCAQIFVNTHIYYILCTPKFIYFPKYLFEVYPTTYIYRPRRIRYPFIIIRSRQYFFLSIGYTHYNLHYKILSLFQNEIKKLPTRTRFIILSACQIAEKTVNYGDWKKDSANFTVDSAKSSIGGTVRNFPKWLITFVYYLISRFQIE